jgi:lipopolysaccharide export system protein LptA
VTFFPSEGTVGNLEGLQTVVAEGDVHITQGNRIARGERAEFDETARTLVLSGGAVLLEGSNEVRGERVIVYLDEERSIVEGSNSRVKAVLVPDGDDGAAVPGATDGRPRGQRRAKRTAAREAPPTSGDEGPAE